ncbi:MAG: M4 family metallopeptidase [Saprospiraceae bacterium]
MKKLFALVLINFIAFSLLAQNKFLDPIVKKNGIALPVYSHKITQEALSHFKNNTGTRELVRNTDYSSSFILNLSLIKHGLNAITDPNTGQLIAIKGNIAKLKRLASHEERCMAYLNEVKEVLHLKNPSKETITISSTKGKKGNIHTKIDQVYKGIKVYGGELSIHEGNGNIYMLQGKTVSIKNDIDMNLAVNEVQAIALAQENVKSYVPIAPKLKALMTNKQTKSKLMIYPKGEGHVLAWNIDILANLGHRETIIIDAISGDVIEKYGTLCKIHNHIEAFVDGSIQSSGIGLNGSRSNIDIFQCGSEFLLIDASKPMYKGVTDCNDADKLINGVIITLDAGGTSPESKSFDYTIGNSAQVDIWSDASAISAHVNGGRAYEYFRSKFGRNSITGNGSNIVSFVNVTEQNGGGMDNAFWNGEFIFYGNGDQAFTPLAGGLDVAGHEMAHGVIQTTANLEYRNESGALNEHFADVFGVLIENEDFRIGEDVINPQVFTTGAMRDMTNPNNGGQNVGDIGYQTAHVNEQFFGEDDNGGVHINSGIPNLAFFKLVTNESFGANINERAAIAEQIWYKALKQYLRSTSNFADMRVATMQVAVEDYGSTVSQAVAAAFDEVGISTENITEAAKELESNPGKEYVVWSDINLSKISINTSDGKVFGDLTTTQHISRPSVTDNGQFTIFVNAEKQIQAVEIDWSIPEIKRDFIVSEQAVYRNAVISRDGSKIAGLTGDLSSGEFDNKIIVFNLTGGDSKEYKLYNPTFSQDNTSTEGVQFADVLEFDLSGENIIYDASNELSGALGQNLSYWDIGIINVWNNAENRYTLGNIFKLFSGLPEDVSVGNPTFSKNSPNIIAFDFIESGDSDEDTKYSVFGINRETGDVNEIFENNTLGYPAYSLNDDKIIFSVENEDNEILAITDLAENKISASGNALIFIEDAEWGVYLGTGERNLSTATEEEIKINQSLSVYPNPTNDILIVKMNDNELEKGHLTLYNMQGQIIMNEPFNKFTEMSLKGLNQGTFIIKYTVGKSNIFRKVVKL